MSTTAGGAVDGRSCRTAVLSWLLVLGFGPASDTDAQTFRVQGGSSTLSQASGGSIDVRGRTYDLTLGTGEIGGRFRLGALVRKKTRRYTLAFGDEAVEFALPTDTFGGRYYFLTRGAGLTVTRPGFSLSGVAGTTANSVGAPFFSATDSADAVGLLFLDKKIAPRLRFVSRNVFAKSQTSLQGVEWLARKPLTFAAMGGIGAGKPYVATSATYDDRRFVVNAAYIAADREFRRIQLDSPSSSEPDRESLSIAIHVSPSWSVDASRQNLLQPVDLRETASRLTVNHLGGNLNVVGFRVAASLFDAHGGRIDNVGAALGIGRALTDTVDTTVTYFTSAAGGGPASDSVVAMVREALGPRFALVQMATHAGGQTTFKFGGSFLSNPLALGIDYQSVYAPFRVGDPFVQAISLNARVQIGNLQLQLSTYTTPTGRTRYTISGSQSLYRSRGGTRSTGDTIRFAKYVIRGRVLEENGQPVLGAVIRIGGELVLTDSEGRFFIRTKKTTPCPVEVATGEFLGPGYFEVSSAPSSVVPATDDRAPTITIRVRRAPLSRTVETSERR